MYQTNSARDAYYKKIESLTEDMLEKMLILNYSLLIFEDNYDMIKSLYDIQTKEDSLFNLTHFSVENLINMTKPNSALNVQHNLKNKDLGLLGLWVYLAGSDGDVNKNSGLTAIINPQGEKIIKGWEEYSRRIRK